MKHGDWTPGRVVRFVPAAALIVFGACGSGNSQEGTTDLTSTDPSVTAAPDTAPTTDGPTTTIRTPEPIPITPPEGMALVWGDEFDGDQIDLANWTYDIGGWGWGNGEAQFYTDRPENARVANGLLAIEARQEKFESSYYTSARIRTQGLREFQYGRMEARIKVPRGDGTWPAFWMLGSNFDNDEGERSENSWPNVGEIDIMEHVGREPDLVMGTVHGPGYSGAGGLTKWFRQDFDVAEDFHVYAVEWDADGIRWLFDDEVYYDLTPEVVGDREWVFDHEFFLILNLAVGGQLPGPIGLDVDFPLYMYVDYVRVYQPVPGSVQEATTEGTDESS